LDNLTTWTTGVKLAGSGVRLLRQSAGVGVVASLKGFAGVQVGVAGIPGLELELDS
jgi:hypothetical protein